MAEQADRGDTASDAVDLNSGPMPGLNASEDAVAWALAHFGAERSLVDSLSVEARAGIRERVERLPQEEAEALLALDAWRERARFSDRIESRVDLMDDEGDAGRSERWTRRIRALCARGPEPGSGPSVRAQLAVVRAMVGDAAAMEWPADDEPAGPLGLVVLDAMNERELTETLEAIGVWQIAGIVSGQGRRRAARVRSKLPRRWAELFQAGLSGNCELAIEAATRIQEVYLGLKRRDFDFDETAERLGVFSIVSAAGGRFERRLDAWSSRAPENAARLVRQLSGLSRRATRLRIGPAFRASLGAFWEYWMEHVGPENTTDE